MKLNELTIKEASEKLASGEITSVELTRACLDRIKEVDDKVKACITVCEERAMSEAKIADEKRKLGEKGPLLGIPYIAKDNILTKDVKTTAASKILDNYIAPFDATVIDKLQKAGAVLLAKANLDEFAHGASTENSAYGVTHNPWDLDRVPGGSSGGSAAAVAADMCMFALGTDTGGSVRHPASLCGITGLKPSYGKASRFGLIAMTSSTDVPGPMTKNVEDAKLVLDVIAGVDRKDATTVVSGVSPEEVETSVKGMRIGLPKEYFADGVRAEVKERVEEVIVKLKEQGALFVEVDLPHTKYGVPVYYIITPSEVSSNLARFDGIRYGFSDKEATCLAEVYKNSRGKSFGDETKRRIMLGTYALSAGYFDAYYLQAQKVRTIIKEELDNALTEVDCLLTPTSVDVAFKIGDQSDDPLKMYMEDIFVTAPSLAGLPAISVPAGFVDDMPVGFQLIGRRNDEDTLFRVGKSFQSVTDHHKKKAVL